VQTGKYFRPSTADDGQILEQRPVTYSGGLTQWEKITTTGDFFHLKNRSTQKYFRPQGNTVNSPMQQRPTSWSGSYTQWTYGPGTSAKVANAKSVVIQKDKTIMYPNPVSQNEAVTIAFGNTTGIKQVLIYDITGKLVYTKETNNTKLTIDNGLSQSKGIYFVTIDKANSLTETLRID